MLVGIQHGNGIIFTVKVRDWFRIELPHENACDGRISTHYRNSA